MQLSELCPACLYKYPLSSDTCRLAASYSKPSPICGHRISPLPYRALHILYHPCECVSPEPILRNCHPAAAAYFPMCWVTLPLPMHPFVQPLLWLHGLWDIKFELDHSIWFSRPNPERETRTFQKGERLRYAIFFCCFKFWCLWISLSICVLFCLLLLPSVAPVGNCPLFLLPNSLVYPPVQTSVFSTFSLYIVRVQSCFIILIIIIIKTWLYGDVTFFSRNKK